MSEKFSGHDLEAGLLKRARSWRDLLPPLVMLQSLRVCGSPAYVCCWLITIVAISSVFSGTIPSSEIEETFWLDRFRLLIAQLQFANPWVVPIAIVIALLPIALTMRAGALYAAGRDGDPLATSLRLVWQRKLTLLLVFILPTVCTCGLLVPVAAFALLEHVPRIGNVLAEVLSVLIVPLVVLIGMVTAGSIVAIPIGWVSVMIEKRQDAFDGLSRGYEYLYRRPIQLMIYVAMSVALATVIELLAKWLAYVALVVTAGVYQSVSGGQALPLVVRISLANLPTAVAMTCLFATFGAVYLLLRSDANQQEIEDIAVSEIDRRENTLPSLKGKTP